MNWWKRLVFRIIINKIRRDDNMRAIIQWLDGKKTYIIYGVTFILGGLKALGIEVPVWLLGMLASLGLITMRAGVTKSK